MLQVDQRQINNLHPNDSWVRDDQYAKTAGGGNRGAVGVYSGVGEAIVWV